MKALVYHGPGEKSWDDVPEPQIQKPTDVIVRIDTTKMDYVEDLVDLIELTAKLGGCPIGKKRSRPVLDLQAGHHELLEHPVEIATVDQCHKVG